MLLKGYTEDLFEKCGIALSDDVYNKLDRYAGLMEEYNRFMNLTGITEPCQVAEKHFLDSLLIFKMVKIPKDARVIDVGTGAGFPGLPMKIYRPDLDITLLDSLKKRVKFLEAVCGETEKAVCIHGRAEEAGRDPLLRESFDIAVARAVAAMPVLAEYCLPFVKVGGRFIALKGPNENLREAKSAVALMGGEIEDISEYSLPCGDKRILGIVKKITACPTKYPRSSGQIMKKKL